MKKNDLQKDRYKMLLFKLLFIMRLVFFFTCLSIFSAVATETYSQSTKLSLSLNDVTIEDVLRSIEDQSEFRFFYTEKVEKDKRISVDFRKTAINEVLDEIFKDTQISYRIVGRQIALFKGSSASEYFQIGQSREIRGKVTNTAGEPIPGATIVIKGTSQGIISDENGNYILPKVPEGSILVFTFVGMKSREVPSQGKSVIDVKLEEETIGIEEVVAIGYGTTKRRETIGAISKIESSAINKLAATSITQSLQGMAAGLNITNTSGGTPGAENKVSIRGLKSISLSSDPLWIIDGVPIITANDALAVNGVRPASPLSMINPNDIASISVLKDAAATAIYGNRASGGVIIITTKSSKKNETDLSINYDGGVSQLPFTQTSVFTNNVEYMAIRDEAMKNTGGTEFQPSFFGQQFPNDPNFTREMALNTNTDHLSALTQIANFHQFGLSANKGFETGGMLFSLSYRDEEGVLQNNNLKRLTARFSTNFTLLDFIDYGANINLMYMNSNGVRTGAGKLAGGWDQWFAMPPMFKLYDANSASGYWFPESGFNAAAYHDPKFIRNNTGDFRTLANTYVQFDLPVKGLTVRGEAGTDVTLTIFRSSTNETFDVTITRQKSLDC